MSNSALPPETTAQGSAFVQALQSTHAGTHTHTHTHTHTCSLARSLPHCVLCWSKSRGQCFSFLGVVYPWMVPFSLLPFILLCLLCVCVCVCICVCVSACVCMYLCACIICKYACLCCSSSKFGFCLLHAVFWGRQVCLAWKQLHLCDHGLWQWLCTVIFSWIL